MSEFDIYVHQVGLLNQKSQYYKQDIIDIDEYLEFIFNELKQYIEESLQIKFKQNIFSEFKKIINKTNNTHDQITKIRYFIKSQIFPQIQKILIYKFNPTG